MSKICKCGNTMHGALDNFCYLCGAPLSEAKIMRCECGNEICSADYYCPKCGRKTNKKDKRSSGNEQQIA